jgi:oligosaccharide repeat unit polymerase
MIIFIYILLGALIVTREVRRHYRCQRIDNLTAFNLAYFLFFVVVPLNVICFGEDVVRQKFAYENYGAGSLWTAVSLTLCYLFFVTGYLLKSPDNREKRVQKQDSFSITDVSRVARTVFLLGVIFSAIYATQVGGILDAISKAEQVRSGAYSIQSKYAFLRYFCQFASDAFVLFFVLAAGKRIKKQEVGTTDRIFLVLSLVSFVYYGLSTAGRRPFIYPIALCYLVYWSLGSRIKKAAIAGLALVFIIAGVGAFIGPVVLSGNVSTLFDIVDINRADWLALSEVAYDNAVSGMGDSYIHFVAAQKASLWQFGFLSDIVELPRDFLPSRILGYEKDRDRMLDATSEFILGHRLEEGITGEEPLGLNGYLLVNFGYSGMFALFLALGALYKWMHCRLVPINSNDSVGWLIYWWVTLGFLMYVRDGMLVFILKEQLTWWLIVFFLLHQRTKHQHWMLKAYRRSLHPQLPRKSQTNEI